MRVSSRRLDSGTPLVSCKSKCFTHAMPVGKVQFPSRLKPMVVFEGIKNQRVFDALSDQKGTFTSYPLTPALGVNGADWLVRSVRLVNAPVWKRVGGSGAPTPVEL